MEMPSTETLTLLMDQMNRMDAKLDNFARDFGNKVEQQGRETRAEFKALRDDVHAQALRHGELRAEVKRLAGIVALGVSTAVAIVIALVRHFFGLG